MCVFCLLLAIIAFVYCFCCFRFHFVVPECVVVVEFDFRGGVIMFLPWLDHIGET